jgi:hypothetical protein
MRGRMKRIAGVLAAAAAALCVIAVLTAGTAAAAAAALCVIAVLTAGTAAAAASKVAAAPRTTIHLTFRGTVNLAALAATSSRTSSAKNRVGTPLHTKSRPGAAAIRPANPTPGSTPLRTLTGPPLGFVGLTTVDSSAVNGFDVEPPDQGLCATANTAMETVNLALGVYTENGMTLLHPVALNEFFGLAPAVTSNGRTTTYGPFLSDRAATTTLRPSGGSSPFWRSTSIR